MPPTIEVLASYWYLRTRYDTPEFLARQAIPVDLFVDSGAFSAYTSGAQVTVEGYARWLREVAPAITAAATLDVISDPDATRANTETLEDAVGDVVHIVPAFHVGSPWAELERLCARYPYVALGGAVGLLDRKAAMLRWLVRCHRIADAHGTRLHGFAQTKPPTPEQLPWYSIDSAYWSIAQRHGKTRLWDTARARFVDVWGGPVQGSATHHSHNSRARAHHNAALLRSYGADPIRFAAWGHAMIGKRGELGRAEWRWMGMVSVLSEWRYAESIRAKRGPVAEPWPGARPGLKYYFAINRPEDVVPFIEAITVPPADWECVRVARELADREPA
jgi:hypothetical protein